MVVITQISEIFLEGESSFFHFFEAQDCCIEALSFLFLPSNLH